MAAIILPISIYLTSFIRYFFLHLISIRFYVLYTTINRGKAEKGSIGHLGEFSELQAVRDGTAHIALGHSCDRGNEVWS